jgi:phage-related protein
MADKKLVVLHGAILTPPFSYDARRLTGFLMRSLQRGILLAMPDSRPMPSVGPKCHELRVRDVEHKLIWRIIYRIDPDAIVVADIFAKKTAKTPPNVIDTCKRRLVALDSRK